MFKLILIFSSVLVASFYKYEDFYEDSVNIGKEKVGYLILFGHKMINGMFSFVMVFNIYKDFLEEDGTEDGVVTFLFDKIIKFNFSFGDD